MTQTKPSLLKQVAGAATGAGIALAIYGAYTVAAPHLQAIVFTPQSWLPQRSEQVVNIASTDIDENKAARIVARTKEIMAQNTEQKDSQHVDDRYTIHRAAPAASSSSVAMVAANTSASNRLTAQAVVPTSQQIENRWDSLDPTQSASQSSSVRSERQITMTSPPVAAAVTTPQPTAVPPPDLPSSGFGLGIVAAGALGGALAARRQRKTR